MIKITRETDLGVLLLAELSREEEGVAPRSSRELGETLNISPAMAGKILKGLARGGLVQAQRGIHGGYYRVHALKDISMADLVTALEGPIGLVECVVHPGSCDHEASCPTRVNWQRVNQVIADALDRVPLSEMVSETIDKTPALLQLERGA